MPVVGSDLAISHFADSNFRVFVQQGAWPKRNEPLVERSVILSQGSRGSTAFRGMRE